MVFPAFFMLLIYLKSYLMWYGWISDNTSKSIHVLLHPFSKVSPSLPPNPDWTWQTLWLMLGVWPAVGVHTETSSSGTKLDVLWCWRLSVTDRDSKKSERDNGERGHKYFLYFLKYLVMLRNREAWYFWHGRLKNSSSIPTRNLKCVLYYEMLASWKYLMVFVQLLWSSFTLLKYIFTLRKQQNTMWNMS